MASNMQEQVMQPDAAGSELKLSILQLDGEQEAACWIMYSPAAFCNLAPSTLTDNKHSLQE